MLNAPYMLSVLTQDMGSDHGHDHGPGHPDTFTERDNLTESHRAAGRYDGPSGCTGRTRPTANES